MRQSDMQNGLSTTLQRVLTWLAVLLVLKVTVSIVLVYRDYLPPNFESDFLRGREAYFFGAYRWAFYTHIVSGPPTLIVGLLLIHERFMQRFPQWHRALGKTQGALVLLLLTPSGFWMAPYALMGPVAAIGFATLAIATAACVVLGWRAAVDRRFAEHRRWMWRCFLLLCSAVILRLIGGLANVTEMGSTWSYPLAAWLSWLAPLAVYELVGPMKRQLKRWGARETGQSLSATASSSPAMEIIARR